MTPPTRGTRALHRLLAERTCDVRELDPAGFRRWLAAHLARWRHDDAFLQRVRIRELRRAHPELLALETEARRAREADAASPLHARLAEVERALGDASKAVAGLGGALQSADAGRWPALARKLEEFRDRERALAGEWDELTGASPERREVRRVEAELRRLRATTGVEVEEARLRKLLRTHGRRSGRAGHGFERRALELTREVVAREPEGETPGRIRVLTGVTLGAARTELDQLVVRLPRRAGHPVEVLALVEVKRNPNDLAHGFARRQENLAWLTGDSAGYRADRYRTRHFPTGHFDRETVHRQEGESFVLAPGSFRRFRRDPATGYFLRRLHFVTRPGRLWGLSAAALGRVSSRVATDARWDPRDEAYLAELLCWCRSLAAPLESPDVFRLYARSPRLARQVVLACA